MQTATQSLRVEPTPLLQNPKGDLPVGSEKDLTWINVGIALAFILFDVGVSTVFRLGIGLSLCVAALRCIGQLAVVATILHQVFETENPWLVALICCAFALFYIGVADSHLLSLVALNFLGTFETGKSTRQVLFDKPRLTSFSSYQQIFETI